MGDKSYNEGILKFATGIRKRNQRQIDDYAKRQERQQLYSTIGSAVGGIANAYGQRQLMNQQRAASAQIGAMPELGLSPDVAGQIAPNDLLRSVLTMRAAQQSRAMTPLQQAQLEQIEYERGLRDQTQANDLQMFEAKLAHERAQTEAATALLKQRLAGDNTTAPFVVTEGSPLHQRGVKPGTYQMSTNEFDQLFPTGNEVAVDPMARDRAYRALMDTITGGVALPDDFPASALPDSALSAGLNRAGVRTTNQQSIEARRQAAAVAASLMGERERQEMLTKLAIKRAELVAGGTAARGRLAASGMAASDLRFGSQGNTMQDFYGQAGALMGEPNLDDIDAMIQALSTAGAAPAGPSLQVDPAMVAPPEASLPSATLKQIDAASLQRYATSTPEQKAVMRANAQANGFDVSVLK